MDLDKAKFYNAIYDFLIEDMTPTIAHNQTNMMVDNIMELTDKINNSMKAKSTDPIILSKNFHTLKNLLLYGDFYYESDLCQDIELELRKSKKVSNIRSIYDELIDSLKM